MSNIKKGYKQTDIGVIPEDWEVKPIGKTLTIRHGRDQKGVISIDGKYPILGTGGLMGYANRFLYNQDSVLIGRKGTINKPMFMNKPFWTVDTLFFSEIKKGHLAKFIYYKFQMIDWYAYNEASGVPSLNAKTIESIDISIPKNITEQTAIATALSDTDALIAALDKKIAKKQQIKQGAMQQLLTGKKRLSGFSGEWVEKTYNDIFQRIPSKKYQINTDQYLDYGKYKVIDQGKTDFVGYTNDESKLFYSNGEGVIVFGDHTRIIKYSNFNFVVGADGVQLLSCKHGFSTKFVYYILTVFEVPNTGYNRHFKFIKEFNCLFPQNKSEQTAIAQILTDMDNEIAQLEKERDKYKELKAGMMQVLLTGKVRLV